MDLLILGASARAAAFSALRAGFSPTAADLFADSDLAAVAPCRRVARPEYPEGLLGIEADLPPGPWLYTGALENRPDLVEALARRRPLWGNGAAVLRSVRSPTVVAQALRDAGLSCPDVRLDPAGVPTDGTWLRKPLASAGGYGVRSHGADTSPGHRPSYYQRFIPGESLSAVFVGAGLVGITKQLIGRPLAPFAYRGNVGPWSVSGRVRERVAAIGGVLADRFGLVGLFGVDLILADDEPWPVEVNPRYTASVEVLELALSRALLADHREACEHRRPPEGPARDVPERFVAKEILFAGGDGRFPGAGDVHTPFEPFRVPRNADVPQAGTPYVRSEPILTVFGSGTTLDDCLASLAEERARWSFPPVDIWPSRSS